MGQFLEAFKGAQVELQQCPNNKDRIVTLLRITRLLASEGLGAITMMPYGWQALQAHKALEPYSDRRNNRQSVSIARDIRYGPMPRNVMDIYVPACVATGNEGDKPSAGDKITLASTTERPVALFCHGGVWASGAKWHYAPMATSLAQQGILTCVVQYSLYPEVKAQDMVAELSNALSWTLDNIRQYGGSPAKVTALGHSAGAQLWAMVLLQRARLACRQGHTKGRRKDAGGEGGTPDCRMPARFIGMAGVYDIAKHYEYEAARGVHYLSTMARAIGGSARFASQSPAAILARAAARSSGHKETAPAARLGRLHGEAIAERVGFQRGGFALGPSTAHAKVSLDANCAKGNAQKSSQEVPGSTRGQEVFDFSLEDARELPPCLLMSSLPDLTVPWYESAEMLWRLYDCGVPAKHLVYPKLSHADFVTAWRPVQNKRLSMSGKSQLGRHASGGKLTVRSGIEGFQEDLLSVLSECTAVHYEQA